MGGTHHYDGGPTLDISACTAVGLPLLGGDGDVQYRWELPVIHYHEIMVIYHYPFLVVITHMFSCILFINDCIHILLVHLDNMYS